MIFGLLKLIQAVNEKTLLLAAALACSGAVAQEQSFICKGEQISTVVYSAGSNDSAKILPAAASKNDQTWVFNEDGLYLLGSKRPIIPISWCEFRDEGKPFCIGNSSNSLSISANNIFELNIVTAEGESTGLMVTRTVVVGRCSKI